MTTFDERAVLPIWGDRIPGNTGASKRTVMTVDTELTMAEAMTRYPGVWDTRSETLGDLRGNDFLVWNNEIVRGFGKETFDDVPFLVPYPVEGSKRCVIIVPGGAYLMKAMEAEGRLLAAFLNDAGISAFVLWYRSYPYREPYPFLDLQRAVRYVRFHCGEFGIEPDKIAVAGCSAGGHLAAVETLCLRNAPVCAPGYVPDAIDAVDGCANGLGLIYPAVSLHKNKLAACLGGREAYDDGEICEALAARYDLCTHIQPGDKPVFLCSCMDDPIVPVTDTLTLAGAVVKAGVPCEMHLFPYGGHGFGACVPGGGGGLFPPADWSACRQWRKLFVSWLKRTL